MLAITPNNSHSTIMTKGTKITRTELIKLKIIATLQINHGVAMVMLMIQGTQEIPMAFHF